MWIVCLKCQALFYAKQTIHIKCQALFYAKQTIHMKYQALFYLKKRRKKKTPSNAFVFEA